MPKSVITTSPAAAATAQQAAGITAGLAGA
jgi:hypothetical protein